MSRRPYRGQVKWRDRAAGVLLGAGLVLAVTACDADPEFTAAPLQPGSSVSMPGSAQGPFAVTRIVDGDTLRVLIDGQDTAVRLIGIDTPETVAPGRDVECAGPEASVYAEQIMSGTSVYLELDPTQGTYDNYGRVLAYVWLDGGNENVMANLAMIQAGLAEEYTYDDAYKYQQLFREAEQQAQDDLLGQWGQIC